MQIRIGEKVLKAFQERKPVVALESTIISHGMPYPKNVETALKVEETVRENGAEPATIGIIDGVPVVGMSEEEIEEFGKRKGILKVSRRDLPYVISQKKWGATTVATTMIFAHKAGIDVFVTGGVGGVHRGAEKTFDVSADLIELASTPVLVVCAGIKAILDLAKTLEVLETLGVTVIGYKSDHLADFYTEDSGLPIDINMENPTEIAQAMLVKKEFDLRGGMLVSNPIESQFAIDKKEIDEAMEKALKELDEQGIKGKDCTPFLLKRIVELTHGDSLESNIALVLNNARLGAKIACEMKRLKEKSCGAIVYKKTKNGYVYLIEHMSLGHVSLPKGHVNYHEKEEETAKREINEETGLNVRIDTSFKEIISYSPYVDQPEIIKDVIFFLGERIEDKSPIDLHDNEVNQSEFLSFEKAYDLLTYETDKNVLKKAAKYLNDPRLK